MKQSYKDLSIFFVAAMSATFSPVALSDSSVTGSTESKEANVCGQLVEREMEPLSNETLVCEEESDEYLLKSMLENCETGCMNIPRDLSALVMEY